MGCPHDLRHTGNQLAAAAGASTRELMHRMGHGSTRAALIHQHATGERDRAIADRLSVLVESTGASPDGVTRRRHHRWLVARQLHAERPRPRP
jgi:hypothetical protein